MVSDPNRNPDDLANERAWAETRSLGNFSSDLAAAGAQSKVGKSPGELTGELGRYKILRRLGMGGMGTVYLAHDSQFDHKVALKVPHFTGTNDQTVVQRFYREARAAIKLRHSNLCPVYDVGEINGQHFLSMAYIEGRPLTELINPNQPLPERQIARIVCKIALALQEAHDNGVVHRDLKPGNIMFDERRNEPIVMDFGLAAQLDRAFDPRLTQTGTLVGSPAYMSPEQVRNEGQPLGPATDIYSLGVILYELLIGRAPFEGSAAHVLGMVAVKEPEPPSRLRPDIDPRLEHICLKAMAKNVDDRYASMRDLAIALADFANPSSAGRQFNPTVTLAELVSSDIISNVGPTAEFSPSPSSVREQPEQVAPPQKPRRAALWIGGTVAAALVVAVGAVVFFRPKSAGQGNGTAAAPSYGQPADGNIRAGALHGPPHPPLFDSQALDDFDASDRNQDGTLMPDEYPLHIILRADANHDQKLTRQEFDAAQKRLGRQLFAPPTPEEEQEMPRHGPPVRPERP